MSTDYPTSLDSLTNPTSDDYLDDPSHPDQHANANDAIEAIENKLGTGASVASANTVLRGTGAGATAFGNIVTADITDASITAAKLASDSVETAKIKNANVTAAKLATDAVETAKIVDLNITDAKLAVKLRAGWDLLATVATRVSNTQMTVTGDITDRLWVGKPLELTDTTTKYYYVTSFSYASPNTTINFTGGSDYVLVGNPTNVYGGLHSSPVGFPNNMIARARAKRSANQAIGTGSWTKVQLNSETFDVGSNFDNATNYRFTAPITGYYQVNALTQWVDPAGSDFYTKIYKNGSGVATAASHNITANILTQSLSDVVQLDAGGYVELYVYQGSGGNKSINNETYMSVALLSLT